MKKNLVQKFTDESSVKSIWSFLYVEKRKGGNDKFRSKVVLITKPARNMSSIDFPPTFEF